TSVSRDWSSDVCSSDLRPPGTPPQKLPHPRSISQQRSPPRTPDAVSVAQLVAGQVIAVRPPAGVLDASEYPSQLPLIGCCDDQLNPPCVPRSLWCTSRSWRASSRSQIACSKASRARSLFSELDTRQPTIRREYTSITNATYTKPRHVATYVRSETHNWFGRSAVKLRSTRSSGRAAAPSGIVVSLKRRPRTAPVSPSCSISRSTLQRPTRMPSRFSCFQTFFAP